jgi:dUTP pyrophosphatase
VQEGDRIAQLIIEKIETPEVLEVDVRILQLSDDKLMRCTASLQDLDETIRGTGGFGSTGGHNSLSVPP